MRHYQSSTEPSTSLIISPLIRTSQRAVSRNFGAFEHHHTLSLLFVVFAIATLFNPNQQPYSNEAREYYHLSRTALNFAQPVQETTVAAVQTLVSSYFLIVLYFGRWYRPELVILRNK
jgi:hypothetical protein